MTDVALVYNVLITLLIVILTLYLISFALVICIILYVKLIIEPVKGVCTSNARLDGKIALVTGGNQGIGLETARDLASRGAKVIIASRQAQKSAEAIADIIATTGNKHVEYKHLDLAKLSSVRQFAEDFNKSYDRLDILVNNAGCLGLDLKKTEDGIDMVMQINYFGPFLLTNLLLDKIIASKPSRIIIVSSWIHNFGRLHPDGYEYKADGFAFLKQFYVYCNSKLYDIMWMKALAKRLPEGVTVNALHPGVVKTNIFDSSPTVFKKTLHFILDLMFKTPKEGAQTTIHLCVADELSNVSGKYFMDCKESQYRSLADDEDLVEKIWNKSVMMTSLKS